MTPTPTESLAHSVVDDPNVALMCDLRHAEICLSIPCSRPNCAATNFLLKHVERCKKEQCKYLNCALARILLAHFHRDHTDHHDCPLCTKQRVLKRLHPGKEPRGSHDDDEDDKEEEEEEEEECKRQRLNDTKENRIDEGKRVAEKATVVEPRIEDVQTEMANARVSMPASTLSPEQARMQMLLHSKTCRWDYCCRQCFWTKQLLTHIKECYEWGCERKGCRASKELLYHYSNCRPVTEQCDLCAKKPDPKQYNGKDYFADLNPQVLRYICRMVGKDEKSLNTVKVLNKRVHSFFQLPGEIRGLYEKVTYEELRIEKAADESMFFHFANTEEKSSGFIHILAENGGVERIRYSASNKAAALEHVKQRYGLLNHQSAESGAPKRLPPALYEALLIALQKFDFVSLHFGSISIDTAFNNFFINGRNSKSEFRLHDREMHLLNTCL